VVGKFLFVRAQVDALIPIAVRVFAALRNEEITFEGDQLELPSQSIVWGHEQRIDIAADLNHLVHPSVIPHRERRRSTRKSFRAASL
jgi:hypothetical protein